MKYSIYLLILLLSGCAVIQAPTGGPKDTLPPQVIEYSPANYTKNFNAKKIEIKLNEYINRSELIKAIRINPPVEFSYSWSGKSLDIEFEEELKENTTYSFQIGTSYKDLCIRLI
jgi:hypothetical protein